MKAYYKTWGMPGDEQGVHWEELETSPCTRAQLGLPEEQEEARAGVTKASDDTSLFYPAHKNSENDLSFYYKKFKCVNSKHLRIQGDYNSGVTRSFVI